MKPKLRINVLQKHIKKGVPDTNSYCPICWAVLDMGVGDPVVDMEPTSPKWVLNITDFETDKKHVYDLPEEAVLFCLQFDKLEVVQPFSFVAVLRED